MATLSVADCDAAKGSIRGDVGCTGEEGPKSTSLSSLVREPPKSLSLFVRGIFNNN